MDTWSHMSLYERKLVAEYLRATDKELFNSDSQNRAEADKLMPSGDDHVVDVHHQQHSVCNSLHNILPRFPIFEWLPSYTGNKLASDLIAGVTVGCMLVPQSMAYSVLAGLPPVVGLYTSIAPQVVYAFFTTSLHLQAGPSALCSIMTAPLIHSEAPNATVEEKCKWSTALCFVVGVELMVFGMMKMGGLVHFISRPLLDAFMSSAAILICISQAPTLRCPSPRLLWLYACALCRPSPSSGSTCPRRNFRFGVLSTSWSI